MENGQSTFYRLWFFVVKSFVISNDYAIQRLFLTQEIQHQPMEHWQLTYMDVHVLLI